MSAPQLGGCEQVGLAIVCHGPRGIYRRRVLECWTCKRRTPFVIRWDGAWYGTTEYCTVCLDGWQDGYRLTRPFQRGWKKERAAYIREMWDAALLPAKWREWINFDAHRATCGELVCAECEAAPA